MRGAMDDLRGDFWGGIAAAALVLPQAMAFGITLFAPWTQDPAAAALAGLVSAVCLSAASAASGGTGGLISAPTGPTLVLLSGVMATLHATAGLAGSPLLLAAFTTVALAGVFQIAMGALRLGGLIKFIPYPVVSGFMTGTGILMILSQVSAVTEEGAAPGAGWVPPAAVALSMAALGWGPRYVRGIPGPALALIVGTVGFHFFCWIAGVRSPDTWVVGALPDASSLDFALDPAGLGV
ncbi:MAG: SulP family inorganic anion transporter, partial [Mariprofundaceae bacterium]